MDNVVNIYSAILWRLWMLNKIQHDDYLTNRQDAYKETVVAHFKLRSPYILDAIKKMAARNTCPRTEIEPTSSSLRVTRVYTVSNRSDK